MIIRSLTESSFVIDSKLSWKENLKIKRQYYAIQVVNMILLPMVFIFIMAIARQIHLDNHPEMKYSTPAFTDGFTKTFDGIIQFSGVLLFISIIFFSLKVIDTPRVKIKKPFRVWAEGAMPEHIRVAREQKRTARKRKVTLIPLSILLLFMITNPGVKRFKDYSGASHYSNFKRKQNWIVLSVYEYGSKKYLGIFLNFFKIAKDDN